MAKARQNLKKRVAQLERRIRNGDGEGPGVFEERERLQVRRGIDIPVPPSVPLQSTEEKSR